VIVPADGLSLSDYLTVAPSASGRISVLKGNTIYRGPDRLYLVVWGIVRLLRPVEDRPPVHLGFFRDGDYFGEASLASLSGVESRDVAIAHTDCELLSWTRDQVFHQAGHRPAILSCLYALALRRREVYIRRMVETFSFDTENALRCALLRLCEEIPLPGCDGWVELPWIPQVVLAEMLGTTREIVTQWMNTFKRRGLIRYNRVHILVWKEKLQDGIFHKAVA
jgi:CRP-like cAMP-binding protein